MPVVTSCVHPGCTTLTMGEHCIEHESIRAVNLPRGRPVPTWMKGSTMIEGESWTDDDSCSTLSPEPLSQAV